MRCPICDGKTLVTETRESPTFGFRRRRRCENGHYFSTQEKVIPREDLIQERKEHINKIKKKKKENAQQKPDGQRSRAPSED